jgi:hypothetical protein
MAGGWCGKQLKREIMKSKIYFPLAIILLFPFLCGYAQEEETEARADRPVRATFESALLIDNQSVMVPMKGTFEFDIMHRFGTMEDGLDNLLGLYASSNIRLGLGYAPIQNLYLNFGFTKFRELLDFSAKYALMEQTMSGRRPISVTYYVNMVVDPRGEDEKDFYNASDRYSFFHQLIIARKFSNDLSIQVAPSLSHFNLIGETAEPDNNDHFAVAVGARYKVSPTTAVLFNYDQPLSSHSVNNPNPNVSFGVELATSAHAFQIFLGNFSSLVPQYNNVFNDYNWIPDEGSDLSFFDNFVENFRIGFNITRLWNF